MDECLNESMCREALFRLVAECTPRMTCCLCGKFFSSPHTFQVCSHTFCWDCIISTLEGPGVTASRCPACHIPGWKKDLHKNCTYEKVVDALKVAGQALDAPGGGHGLGALGHGVLGQEETSGQHEALGAADDEHGEAASGSGSDSDCEPEPVPTAEAEARVGVGNGAGMDVDMDARTGVGVSGACDAQAMQQQQQQRDDRPHLEVSCAPLVRPPTAATAAYTPTPALEARALNGKSTGRGSPPPASAPAPAHVLASYRAVQTALASAIASALGPGVPQGLRLPAAWQHGTAAGAHGTGGGTRHSHSRGSACSGVAAGATDVARTVPAPTAGEGALLAADLAVVSAWLAEGERIRAARQAALGRPGGVAGMLA